MTRAEIENHIDELKKELNELVKSQNRQYELILEISRKLDRYIVMYHKISKSNKK